MDIRIYPKRVPKRVNIGRMEPKKVQLMSKVAPSFRDYVVKNAEFYRMSNSGLVETCIDLHQRMGHENALKFLRLAGKRTGGWREFRAWLDEQDKKNNAHSHE